MSSTNELHTSSRRRACDRCIVAKAKCSPNLQDINTSGVCQRCAKLKKPCVFANPIQLPVKRKTGDRVRELEEKLEALTTLLADQSSQINQISQISTPSHSASSAGISSWNGEVSVRPVSSIPNIHETPGRQDAVPSTSPVPASAVPRSDRHDAVSSTTTLDSRDFVDDGLITMAYADRHLHLYKTEMTPNSPFVVISPDIDAATLRRTSPFLFLCIICASSFQNYELQDKLNHRIRQIICDRIVMNSDRSLELLQGLIVHGTWFASHDLQVPQMHLIVKLVHLMTGDLGLDQPPRPHIPIPPESHCHRPYRTFTTQTGLGHPLAEKRAFLGSYHLVCGFGVFRKHSYSVKQTKFLDQCCSVIAEACEYPTDCWIPHIIKTQSLIHDAVHAADTFVGQSSLMLEVYVKYVSQAVADIEAALPKTIIPPPQTFTLKMKYIILFVYEGALHAHDPGTNTSTDRLHGTHLVHLLEGARDCVEYWLSLPVSTLMTVGVHTNAILWYSLIMIPKILILPSGNGWDAQIGRTAVDFVQLIGKLLQVFENLGEAAKAHLIEYGLYQPGQMIAFSWWSIPVNKILYMYKRWCQDAEEDVAARLRVFGDAIPPHWHSNLDAEQSDAGAVGTGAGKGLGVNRLPTQGVDSNMRDGLDTVTVQQELNAPLQPAGSVPAFWMPESDLTSWLEQDWQQMLRDIAFLPAPAGEQQY